MVEYDRYIGKVMDEGCSVFELMWINLKELFLEQLHCVAWVVLSSVVVYAVAHCVVVLVELCGVIVSCNSPIGITCRSKEKLYFSNSE